MNELRRYLTAAAIALGLSALVIWGLAAGQHENMPPDARLRRETTRGGMPAIENHMKLHSRRMLALAGTFAGLATLAGVASFALKMKRK